jgi:hypothetical protein
MFSAKKSNLMFYSFCLSTTLFFSSCNKDKTETPKSDQLIRFQWQAIAPDGAPQIKVVNQFGEAVAQAQILIGDAQGIPFSGNLIETDAKGVAIGPKDWTRPAHVTVDAAGYIRQTLLNQKPGNLTLKLNNSFLPQRTQLQGQVTQLPIVNGDKLIDFGLVMPSLSKSDILNFDLDQVISPYTDILSVAGQQAPLPSNVSLPTQKENYIFNLTISKPLYRLMVPTLGPKRFYAARGRFPLKQVVDELRAGKPFYEVLNYMTILGGGIRETQVVNTTTTNLDIPGNELEFKNTIQVQSPQTQADEVLMMIATNEVAGTMIPSDVKKSTSNQAISLTSMANSPAFVVSVIKKQAEFMTGTSSSDRMSASLQPYVLGAKQTLLPLVANPTIESTTSYLIHLPAAPIATGIRGIAVSAVISDLVESTDGNKKIMTAHKRWEVVGLGWGTDIQLPVWPLAHLTARKKVEINFIGSSNQKPVDLDDSLIDAATHVSHASTEF